MFRLAVLTISDKGSRRERPDESGPEIQRLALEKGFSLAHAAVLPDERPVIAAELARLCDQGLADCILTTGGTGFSPRDVTPEATLDVAERLCPGIPEAMRALSLTVTKRAMLTRAVAGIRGRTLIVNLPGSKKAVRECLGFIIDELPHGLELLCRGAGECGNAP